MARAWRYALCAVAVVVIAGACQPRIDTHGFMPRPELIAQLVPGKQDKRAVARIMGTASTISTFDSNIWYYITQRTENEAFFKPEIVDQTILALAFDDRSVLAEIHEYTIKDGRIVEPVERKTPTAGKQLTILQQLFGNIGRFGRPPPGPGGG